MAGKGLHGLIRLHDWRVNEKQRALAALLGEIARMEDRIRQLEAELAHEQQVARDLPAEASLFFGTFAQGITDRRHEIERAIAEVEKKVAKARDLLREAYRDLKKYELAQEARDARETAERGRRDQIQLDEIGLQTFLRGRSGD